MSSLDLDVEMTEDDFHRYIASSASYESQPKSRNLTSRLNKLFHKNRSGNASVHSDRATTHSEEEVESVMGMTVGENSVSGTFTVASLDTVKVSNRKVRPEQEKQSPHHDPKKNPWHKLTKKMSNVKNHMLDIAEHPFTAPPRSRSVSSPSVRREVDNAYPIRKRVESDQTRSRHNSKGDNSQKIDDAIRGRFDGMDVLSLGSARLPSVPRTPDALTRHAPMLRPQDMVRDMLYTSAGREPPELVLEGFIVKDRWIVRLENLNGDSNVPQLQSTDEDDEDETDGSPQLPTSELMTAMWGRHRTPPPTHALHDQKDIFQMAAACSVPIDVDEESFIIDTPAHLQAVHDIASIPLKAGRFEEALDIFQKILKGLEMKHGNEPNHVVGSTLHNIGVLYLWMGRYREAWESLNQAVSVRIRSLSTGHADIAVSLGREAIALFALEHYNDAILVLTKSLKISCSKNATRAKILNNLGVCYYQKQEHMEAMKAFTSALEIQRVWLDEKVRRTAIVFDASVTLGNMGKLYLEQEKYRLSFFVNEEALLLQTTAFPKDHDIVLRSLDSIAYARAREGDHEKALQIYRGILRSQDTRFGPASKESMETTKLLGILYIKTGGFDEALECFTTLVKWQMAHLPNNDPNLQRTREYIKKIESHLDDEDEVSVWI